MVHQAVHEVWTGLEEGQHLGKEFMSTAQPGRLCDRRRRLAQGDALRSITAAVVTHGVQNPACPYEGEPCK